MRSQLDAVERHLRKYRKIRRAIERQRNGPAEKAVFASLCGKVQWAEHHVTAAIIAALPIPEDMKDDVLADIPKGLVHYPEIFPMLGIIAHRMVDVRAAIQQAMVDQMWALTSLNPRRALGLRPNIAPILADLDELASAFD